MDIEQLVSPALGFAAGLATGWVGHALTLSRDRRKELIEAAAPIRAYLLSHVNDPRPSGQQPTSLEIDTFTQCLRGRKRAAFMRAWLALDHATACAPTVPGSTYFVNYADPESIKVALRRCLAFTEVR